MWPFSAQHDVVRLGRHVVEYWSSDHRGLTRRAEVLLRIDGPPTAAALRVGLRTLFEGVATEGQVGAAATRAIDMVVESAWLPVLPLPTGHAFWSQQKLIALARHHLQELYGAGEGGDRLIALDHAAGAQTAIAFGLAPAVRSALLHGAADARCRVRSMQPALAWAWHRFDAQLRRTHARWWLWVEQDRALVCHVQSQRITSLNAGAPVPTDFGHAARLIAVEAVRQGSAVHESRGVVAVWRPYPVSGTSGHASTLVCLSVAGETLGASPSLVATPSPQPRAS